MLKRFLNIFLFIFIITSCFSQTDTRTSKNEIIQINETIKDLSKIIAESPNNADPYFKRGVLYLESEKFNKAISDFDQAIVLMPEATIVYSYRAKAFFELQQFDKSVSDFTRALEFTPNNWKLYSLRGTTYFSKKDFEQAHIDFSTAIEQLLNVFQNIENQKEQLSDLYLFRGDTNASLSNYGAAEDDFIKSLEFNPENQVAKDYLQKILSLK